MTIIGYRLTQNEAPVDDFDTMAHAQQEADDRAVRLGQSPVMWFQRFEGVDAFGIGYSSGPNEVTFHVAPVYSVEDVDDEC